MKPTLLISLVGLLVAGPDVALASPGAASLQQEEDDLLGGTHRAICYSGFRRGQHPDRGEGAVNPSEAEILEDLRILSRDGNFSLIRLYDAKENSQTVLRLIREHELDLKVLLGAWLDAEVSNPGCPWQKEPYPDEVLAANEKKNVREVKEVVRLAKAYPEEVVAVAVGNEALVEWTDHMVPLKSLATYVRYVKKSIKQPVTVAENYAWWAKSGKALAAELDFVSVHVYPAWEGKAVDEALAFGTGNLAAVRKTLPESRLVITEAGWATIAHEFGGRAGEAEQERYYHEVMKRAEELNITTFFFEAFDESWKGDPNNEFGAEKHWGLFTEDRVPKRAMEKLYPDLTGKGGE